MSHCSFIFSTLFFLFPSSFSLISLVLPPHPSFPLRYFLLFLASFSSFCVPILFLLPSFSLTLYSFSSFSSFYPSSSLFPRLSPDSSFFSFSPFLPILLFPVRPPFFPLLIHLLSSSFSYHILFLPSFFISSSIFLRPR